MAEKLLYNLNNGRKLEIIQRKFDGAVLLHYEDSKGNTENTTAAGEMFIPAGDMVMLINYYHYIKENDIQCDFINPNGKNTKE